MLFLKTSLLKRIENAFFVLVFLTYVENLDFRVVVRKSLDILSEYENIRNTKTPDFCLTWHFVANYKQEQSFTGVT